MTTQHHTTHRAHTSFSKNSYKRILCQTQYIHRLVLFLGCLFACVAQPCCAQPSTQDENLKIYKKDGWELRITFRAKGSRSEGRDGRLFLNSKEVFAKEKGEVISTPLGEMKYYKDKSQIEHLWDTSGWNFSDLSDRNEQFIQNN